MVPSIGLRSVILTFSGHTQSYFSVYVVSQGHNMYKLQYISPEEVKIVSFQQ